MKFNEKFREIVKKSGKQQKEIAEKIGVAPSTISKLLNEDTEPSAYVLVQIAKCFNVSVDWLLGISESKQVKEIRKAECRTLGLSDYAIDVLRKNAWQNRKGFNSRLLFGLNVLFEQDKEAQTESNGESVLWNLCKLFEFIYDDYEIKIDSSNKLTLSRVKGNKREASESNINDAIQKDYYITKYIDFICAGLKKLYEQRSNIDKDKLPGIRF